MPARAYLRYRQGIEIEGPTRFAPMGPTHPSRNDKCPVCGEMVGDRTPLRVRVAFKLDDLDVEQAYKYKAGRWFAAPAEILHDRCTTRRASYDNPATVTVVLDDADV